MEGRSWGGGIMGGDTKEGTQWNGHHERNTMEGTPWRGHHEGYNIKWIPWRVHHEGDTMKGTSCKGLHGREII